MSLLLDALKRAEQEKLARQGSSGSHPATPAPASPTPPVPRTSLELESFDAPRSMSAAFGGPVSGALATPAVTAAPAGDRGSAQQVFAAKRAPAPPTDSKTPVLVGLGLAIAIVLALGGGYVWYQMQTLSPRVQPIATQRPVTPVTPVMPGPVPMPPAAPTAAPGGSTPPLALLKPETAPIDPVKTRPAPRAAEQLVMDLLREAPASGATPPLKLSRSIDPPRVAAEVTAGYDALKRGDMVTAKSNYQSALAADPRGLDALLGLATVEARSGSRESAQQLYRRALEIDPRNAVALAGLAALADFSRPGPLEAQLKADLARVPQSAALQFTLGNVYAAQSRWSEAQATFFEAHRLEPGNADFAYNLAVSLDHLGQVRPATEYYGKALALARGQRVNFDTQAVTRRLAELRS